MRNPMRWYHREPTLEEMLSDSIVRDLMEADGVDPRELSQMLREVARERRRNGMCRVAMGSELSNSCS